MTEGDLKEVLKEIKLVRKKLERLEGLVEERLVECEPLLADEVEAVAEYEAAKKKESCGSCAFEGRSERDVTFDEFFSLRP